MKKIYKGLAGVLSAGILSLLALIIYAQLSLPDQWQAAQGEEIFINSKLSLVSLKNTQAPLQKGLVANDDYGNQYRVDFKLFDTVPIKQVQVQLVDRKTVVPGGVPFGIKMFTEGVIIVGMSDIQNGAENLSPAKDAGLKIGDILMQIDDQDLIRNEDVAQRISESDGNEVKITLNRNGQEMDVYVQPVQSEFDEGYKAGIWVRDSSAGIGTLTYYHPETLRFAGLGHAVCDVDTGDIMPLSSGEIVNVNISGANIGHSGKPGELKGNFIGLDPIGDLLANCEDGVYGTLHAPLGLCDPIPMALKQEVQAGPAQILSTLSGSQPQYFDIVIEKVNYSNKNSSKSMIIQVVDPDLLAATGGIVQGMSGSPIIQNDMLVGAVTHVFVNDPTRGYGVFAENMENTMNFVENTDN